MKFNLSENKITAYFRTSYTELKKVTWPTPKETRNYTLLVIGISLAVAAFLGILDFGFTWMLQTLLALKG